MIYGIYNTKTNTFTYASAGLNVSPIVIKKSGELREICVDGFAICMLGDIITPFFQDRQLQLEAGDKLLFFTDGLIEAENSHGNKYTYERLSSVISKNSLLSAQNLARALENDLMSYIGNKKLKDDVTFMAMEAL
jgi:phosphoserine phosphatase RsbU/P